MRPLPAGAKSVPAPGELRVVDEELYLGTVGGTAGSAAEGGAVRLLEVQIEGKPRMAGATFARDYQVKVGAEVGLATVSPARAAAFELLERIGAGTAHSDDLLHGPRLAGMSQPDKDLTTTLVLGVLRWQIALDARLRPLLSRRWHCGWGRFNCCTSNACHRTLRCTKAWSWCGRLGMGMQRVW